MVADRDEAGAAQVAGELKAITSKEFVASTVVDIRSREAIAKALAGHGRGLWRRRYSHQYGGAVSLLARRRDSRQHVGHHAGYERDRQLPARR
jgi:hypothetical protein